MLRTNTNRNPKRGALTGLAGQTDRIGRPNTPPAKERAEKPSREAHTLEKGGSMKKKGKVKKLRWGRTRLTFARLKLTRWTTHLKQFRKTKKNPYWRKAS